MLLNIVYYNHAETVQCVITITNFLDRPIRAEHRYAMSRVLG